MKNERILREYVKHVLLEREVIKEDAGYSGYADAGITAADMAGSSPYGMSFGSRSELTKTFIEPFTDVFKTAVGKTKEITRKTGTFLQVALSTVLTTLIPVLGADYKKIFDNEKKSIDKIRTQYKDVYQRTNEALASSDAGFLAFMASPEAAISLWAVSKTPEFISGVLSTLTGGYSDELFGKFKEANFVDSGKRGERDKSKSREKSQRDRADIERRRERVVTRNTEKEKVEKYAEKEKDESGLSAAFGESVVLSPHKVRLHEANSDEISEEEIKKKIFTSEKFIKKCLEAPQVNEMKRSAIQLYRSTLNETYAQIEELFTRVKTVEDLKKIAKKSIPELDKIENLQGEEKEKSEQMIIQAVRKNMKEFYIKNLSSQVEEVIKAGIPEDSQYVKDYKSTIQKIKNL